MDRSSAANILIEAFQRGNVRISVEFFRVLWSGHPCEKWKAELLGKEVLDLRPALLDRNFSCFYELTTVGKIGLLPAYLLSMLASASAYDGLYAPVMGYLDQPGWPPEEDHADFWREMLDSYDSQQLKAVATAVFAIEDQVEETDLWEDFDKASRLRLWRGIVEEHGDG